RFIRETAAAIGCAVDFVAGAVLAILGAATGTSLALAVTPDWHELALLWILLVGPSGDGKSPALRAVCEPLYAAHARAVREYETRWTIYEQARRRALTPKDRAAAETLRPAPLVRRFLDDVTVEAIAPILRSTPKGIPLVKDELSGWVLSMDQYRAGGRGAD